MERLDPAHLSLLPPRQPEKNSALTTSTCHSTGTSLFKGILPDPAPPASLHHGDKEEDGGGHHQTLLESSSGLHPNDISPDHGMKPRLTNTTATLICTRKTRAPFHSHRRPAAPSDEALDRAGQPWSTLKRGAVEERRRGRKEPPKFWLAPILGVIQTAPWSHSELIGST